MNRFVLLAGGLLCAPSLALADPAAAQVPSPSDRALILALEAQKLGAATQKLADDIAMIQRRVGDLEKRCGEACQDKPPAPK